MCENRWFVTREKKVHQIRFNGTFNDGNVEKCHWNGKRVHVLLKRECDVFFLFCFFFFRYHQLNISSSSSSFSRSIEWKCVTLKFSTRFFFFFVFRSTKEMSIRKVFNANTKNNRDKFELILKIDKVSF